MKLYKAVFWNKTIYWDENGDAVGVSDATRTYVPPAGATVVRGGMDTAATVRSARGERPVPTEYGPER